MMISKERNIILDYIKSVKPRSSGHKILSQNEYLGGNVAQFEYQDNGQTITQWVIATRQHKGYADSESQLIQQLESASNKEREKMDWINQVFNISGLIALILVCASVYITITSKNGDVPEHLKASVLTIVGSRYGAG